MQVEYRDGESAFSPESFVGLAQRVWPQEYDMARAGTALEKTINIGAWMGERLVGSVRVLSDGYFFNTVPELMVDPESSMPRPMSTSTAASIPMISSFPTFIIRPTA